MDRQMTPADLRAARHALGLTQKGLAKALRMGAHGWQSISAWESDNNDRGVPGPVQVAVEALVRDHRSVCASTPAVGWREAVQECDRWLALASGWRP